MAKRKDLTALQERMIASTYALGGVTLRELAAEYGVSKDKILSIINKNKEIKTLADTKKKEADQQAYDDICAFFESRKGALAGKVAKALDVSDETLDATSVRDRAGFAKVVTELICLINQQRSGGGAEDGEENRITFVFADTAMKGGGEDA